MITVTQGRLGGEAEGEERKRRRAGMRFSGSSLLSVVPFTRLAFFTRSLQSSYQGSYSPSPLLSNSH